MGKSPRRLVEIAARTMVKCVTWIDLAVWIVLRGGNLCGQVKVARYVQQESMRRHRAAAAPHAFQVTILLLRANPAIHAQQDRRETPVTNPSAMIVLLVTMPTLRPGAVLLSVGNAMQVKGQMPLDPIARAVHLDVMQQRLVSSAQLARQEGGAVAAKKPAQIVFLAMLPLLAAHLVRNAL